MRENNVKRALREGGVPLGTMVFEFASPGMGRITASAGAEFAIFDMEHSGLSVETIKMLFATSRAADLVPMVRVPATEYHFLARVLDVGAMGIMVPMVQDEAQARRIVESAKYPPTGRRGAGFGLAHDDFEKGADLVAKMSNANDETLLIAQIETRSGVENVDAIAAVEGIDVLWIGHFDLTNFMGIPGQFTSDAYLDAVGQVIAACEKHGKVAGIMVGDTVTGKAMLDQGFRAVAYSGDLWIYQQALRDGISVLREVASGQ